jgi:S1-C subfamily serine protease
MTTFSTTPLARGAPRAVALDGRNARGRGRRRGPTARRATTTTTTTTTREDDDGEIVAKGARDATARAREAWTRATARAMASVMFVTVTAASAPVGAEARVGAVETPTPTNASRREWTRDDEKEYENDDAWRSRQAPEVTLRDGAVDLPTPARLVERDGTYTTRQASQRLTASERETVHLFNDAKSSVVYITNVAVRRDAFTLNLTETPQGAGSGIVWDDKGHLVTNYHVIAGANQLKVSFLPRKGGVQNQKVYDAAIVGYDDDKDIAVLKVSDPEALREMKPLTIGTSGDAMVGQRVFAIGNPFGLDHTLTTGIISGLGREIQSGNTGRPIDGIIQTDAAINPGNSGGPLLNSGGQLIGVNTAIYSASGTSSGVGFALPSDMVSGIVDQLIRFGRVTRPILGVSFAPDGALDQLGLGGVLVLDARAGGPADRAGVRSTTRDESGRLILGDIIVELAGYPINDSSDLFRALDKLSVGEIVDVKLVRGVDQVTARIELDDIKDMKPPTPTNTIVPMRVKKSPGSPY